MPELVEGPFGDPPRRHSRQPGPDRLARLEAQMEMLTRSVAELVAEQGRQRRAAVPVPPRRANNPRRRGDTFLRVVRAAVIGAAVLAGIVALLSSPARIHRERYTPICTVTCSRPVAHHRVSGPGR